MLILQQKLEEFEKEIINTCRTRPIGMALDFSKQFIKEEKILNRGEKLKC